MSEEMDNSNSADKSVKSVQFTRSQLIEQVDQILEVLSNIDRVLQNIETTATYLMESNAR